MKSGSCDILTRELSVAAYSLTLHTPAEKKKIFSLPSNSPASDKFPQVSPWGATNTTSNSQYPSMNFHSFQSAPPNFLLSSTKECSSPLFSKLFYGSPEFAWPKFQFFCYSQVNSILLINWLTFLFQRFAVWYKFCIFSQFAVCVLFL